MGKLTPKARQDQYVSEFAVIEGNCPSGWRGVADYQDGIEFGENGEYKLPFTEHKDAKGKTNDVIFNGLKLREMVAPREDAVKRNEIEGRISRNRVSLAERGPNQGAAGVSVASASTTFIAPNNEAPPEPELPNRK